MRLFLFVLLLPCFLLLSAGPAVSRDSLVVYVFLLDECRISQEMTPHLNALYTQYSPGIHFAGIFPNKATKEQAMALFVEKYQIRFPVQLDHEKMLAKKWQATILPEVVLFNETKQRIEYRGLINDLYVKPGKRRHKIKKHYLSDAIEHILGGGRPSIPETKPVGCFINFQENENQKPW